VVASGNLLLSVCIGFHYFIKVRGSGFIGQGLRDRVLGFRVQGLEDRV